MRNTIGLVIQTRQKRGINSTSTVRSSSRPISIAKVNIHFGGCRQALENCPPGQ